MTTNLMVFIAGDNDLDTFGTTDIEEMMSVQDTGDKLTILVQQDQSVLARDSSTKRYVIRHGEKVETIHMGETNTGEVSTLREFIEWGLTEHEAERNIVILWNHGGGTRDEEYGQYDNNQTTIESIAQRVRLAPSRATGKSTVRAINANPTLGNQASFFPQELRLKRIAELMKTYQEERGEPSRDLLEIESKSILFDDESRDFLDNLELKRVFEGLEKKIDIVGFDACLMAMMEIAYQLKDHAEIVVGSEELEPGKGWDYEAIVKYLVANPTASNEDVSKEIIRSFIVSYENQTSLKVTLSSIRTSKLEAVASLMDNFAHTILRKESNVRGALLSVVDETETFVYPVREMSVRIAKTKGFWGYFVPFMIISSFAGFYEIVEWGAASVVYPEAGAAFLGSQGDIWDAQKDMLVAIVGSLGTLFMVMIVHMIYNRDFYHEFKESFKLPKDDKPMGEVLLDEMMNGKKNA